MTSRATLLGIAALLAGPLLTTPGVAQDAPPRGGAPGNPPGTAAGRTAAGTSTSSTPTPPASTAPPRAPTTGSVAQPSTLGTSPSLRQATRDPASGGQPPPRP